MEFFFVVGAMLGALAGFVWFLVWVAAGGARKQGDRVIQRAEERQLRKQWAREDFEKEKARRQAAAESE